MVSFKLPGNPKSPRISKNPRKNMRSGKENRPGCDAPEQNDKQEKAQDPSPIKKEAGQPIKKKPRERAESYQVIKRIDIEKIGVNRPAQTKQSIDDLEVTSNMMKENIRKENLQKITTLIEDIIKNIVKNPDKIKIVLYQISGEGLLARIYADADDVGKIIGGKGFVVRAIATIGNAILKKQQRGEGNFILDRIMRISDMERAEKKFQKEQIEEKSIPSEE